MKKFFSFLFLLALVLSSLGELFFFPATALAITCGTGSNITFTDIGSGQCRGFITTTGASTLTRAHQLDIRKYHRSHWWRRGWSI